MDCPQYSVSEFGVFDSNVKFPKQIVTQERPVEEYELELYVTDCPGSSWIDGVWQPLRQGTFVCAKPGQLRKSRLPFKCHYIHLQTDDTDLCKLLNSLPDHIVLWQLREAAQIFTDMLGVESADQIQDRLLLQECVSRLIRLLSRYRKASADEPVYTVAHQKALLSVESFIRKNLDQPLSLEQLASHCHLSPGYFHVLFTKYFRKTPAQFVLDCRISAAKTGLLADNCNLANLARQCGFSSLSYFCCKFKQVTGKTPMAFRKSMLGRLNV